MHLLQDPSFWVAASLIVFIMLVARPVGRIVAKALDKRSADISTEISDAELLKEDAQKLLAKYKKNKAKTLNEAEEIILNAQEQAKAMLKSAKSDIDKEIANKLEIALQKISQTEAAVVQQVRDNAVEMTLSATRKLIMDHMGSQEAELLVNKAAETIDRKFH